MRIGFNTKYNSVLADLNRLSSELNLTQLKISSGKNFTRPSDSPSDVVISLNYKQGINRIEKYQKAIDEGLAFLKTQEATLGQVEDLVARAKVLAIQAANATQDINARKATAEEIDKIFQAVLSLANSQLGEKYLFSGQKTSGFPPGAFPFQLTKETLPNGQTIEKVVYNGSVEDFSISYDKGMQIKLGENGQKIFMDSGIFETLIGLKRLLLKDNQIDYQQETYNIQEFIGKLDEVYNHIAAKRGLVGAQISHLETKKELYIDFKQTLENNLGEVESADLAELATKMQQLSIAYDAALKATAMVSGMSLVKYV
ncbi:flagellar hook-associated protein 3 [Thermodesulfobacterium sp. TA1]|uniref:flagellar hook-associated protein FlgL n=1 Tax=Thermodesulfobacterium sp. TA1 TaxID=2234087 RepID=UPI0012327B4C|nr:flagellar hook-associated protein FlgL [Thermodesulfobacterium sp. TA1]QER42375.1 flagellar hook-associated protein 3 [Thermodesulfobacterium sp. TA1]